jgi:hypothetical protein
MTMEGSIKKEIGNCCHSCHPWLATAEQQPPSRDESVVAKICDRQQPTADRAGPAKHQSWLLRQDRPKFGPVSPWPSIVDLLKEKDPGWLRGLLVIYSQGPLGPSTRSAEPSVPLTSAETARLATHFRH